MNPLNCCPRLVTLVKRTASRILPTRLIPAVGKPLDPKSPEAQALAAMRKEQLASGQIKVMDMETGRIIEK